MHANDHQSKLMKPRVLVLPIAAIIIFALCVYKLSQPQQDVSARAENYQYLQLPPNFVLFDQQNRSVKLKRYLGRHELIVVFYHTRVTDTDAGLQVEMNPLMQAMLNRLDQIESRNIILIGVTNAIPQHNRKLLEQRGIRSRSLVILSDFLGDVHAMWGCWDQQQQKPIDSVFFVDRAGRVLHNQQGPVPLGDPLSFLYEKLN